LESKVDGEEEKKKQQSKKVGDWIKKNPKRWDKILAEAKKELGASRGFYHAASKGTKISLVKFRAMQKVSNMIEYGHADQEKSRQEGDSADRETVPQA
jgi:hypothetical protein